MPPVETIPSSTEPSVSADYRARIAAPKIPAPPPAPSRTTLAVIAIYTGVLLTLALWADARLGGALLCAFAALAAWSFTVALLHALPLRTFSHAESNASRHFLRRLRETASRSFPKLFPGTALLLAAGLVAHHLGRAAHIVAIFPAPADSARLIALVLGASAVVSWFLAALVRAELTDGGDARLAPLRQLLLALAATQLAGALLIVLQLAAGVDWLRACAFAIGTLAAVLAAEGLLGLAVGFYQPRALRERAAPPGGSALLAWAFRRDNPWIAVAQSLEQTFGLKVGETALFPFLQRIFEPALLGGVALLWLGTAVTMVPPDSAGVEVRFGRHVSPALPPGLHAHLPWPFAHVALVPARRVQALTLGFDQDLDGPIFWAEQHYAGEKSLLVGRGDELLTVSLPLHYRIGDPVTFLENTRDPAAALRSLGYRELLALTSTHTSFGLMTTDRAEVAATLRTRLQAACDRHHLGLEILWVGLKDIHPPVPVAPAFQDVVSAEEEKLTTIDRERATSTTTLQEARSAARRLRSEADAVFRERTALAAGEAARFTANSTAALAAPDVFRTRRTFESAELGLRDAKNLLVVPSATARTEYFLDVKSPLPLLPTLVR